MPEEVTAVLLAPSILYELMVEGSSPTETPHAVHVAQRLARVSDGVVFDHQAGHTWARGRLRAPTPVQRERSMSSSSIGKSALTGSAPRVAAAWLDLARRPLSVSLPRRFGSPEPLAMELDVDGPDRLRTGRARR